MGFGNLKTTVHIPTDASLGAYTLSVVEAIAYVITVCYHSRLSYHTGDTVTAVGLLPIVRCLLLLCCCCCTSYRSCRVCNGRSVFIFMSGLALQDTADTRLDNAYHYVPVNNIITVLCFYCLIETLLGSRDNSDETTEATKRNTATITATTSHEVGNDRPTGVIYVCHVCTHGYV